MDKVLLDFDSQKIFKKTDRQILNCPVATISMKVLNRIGDLSKKRRNTIAGAFVKRIEWNERTACVTIREINEKK